MSVHGTVDVLLIEDPAEIAKANSPKGKPFLQLTFNKGSGVELTLDITTNLAEMIGGAGAGLRMRWEDRNAAIGEPKGHA